METVLKLVLTLASHLTLARSSSYFSSRRIAVALIAFVAFLVGLAAIGCVVGALWIECLPLVGPVGAWLVAALVLVLFAGILLLIGRNLLQTPPPSPLKAVGLEDFVRGADIAPLLREYKVELLLGAVVIGLLVGARRAKPPSERKS